MSLSGFSKALSSLAKAFPDLSEALLPEREPLSARFRVLPWLALSCHYIYDVITQGGAEYAYLGNRELAADHR